MKKLINKIRFKQFILLVLILGSSLFIKNKAFASAILEQSDNSFQFTTSSGQFENTTLKQRLGTGLNGNLGSLELKAIKYTGAQPDTYQGALFQECTTSAYITCSNISVDGHNTDFYTSSTVISSTSSVTTSVINYPSGFVFNPAKYYQFHSLFCVAVNDCTATYGNFIYGSDTAGTADIYCINDYACHLNTEHTLYFVLNNDIPDSTYIRFSVNLLTGSILKDFNKWSFCYNLPFDFFTGQRTVNIVVHDAGNTDTLPEFITDFVNGTNMGCIIQDKEISLAARSHTLTADLVDSIYGVVATDSTTVTILSGTATEFPTPQQPSPAPQNYCESTSSNIFGQALCQTFIGPLIFLFVPPDGFFQYTLDSAINSVKDKAIFSSYLDVKNKLEENISSTTNPTIDTSVSLVTPLAAGHTFDLDITSLDTNGSQASNALSSLRSWTNAFLIVGAGFALTFKVWRFFRPL